MPPRANTTAVTVAAAVAVAVTADVVGIDATCKRGGHHGVAHSKGVQVAARVRQQVAGAISHASHRLPPLILQVLDRSCLERDATVVVGMHLRGEHDGHFVQPVRCQPSMCVLHAGLEPSSESNLMHTPKHACNKSTQGHGRLCDQLAPRKNHRHRHAQFGTAMTNH